jgi:hypothetical protein
VKWLAVWIAFATATIECYTRQAQSWRTKLSVRQKQTSLLSLAVTIVQATLAPLVNPKV